MYLIHLTNFFLLLNANLTLSSNQFKRTRGELCNLSSFFSTLGIIHPLSYQHTSEQNGIVERHHHHVVETDVTLLSKSNVPPKFCHFAFDTTTYLNN